jgi:CBS-domain-containing membrane protein
MPIVDKKNKVLGNVSLSDIKVTYLALSCVLQLHLTLLQIIGKRGNEFMTLHLPVLEFLKASGQERPYPIITYNKHDHFKSILDKLVTFRVHRIYYTDEQGCLLGVVSLTDVIKFIAAFC